MDPVESRELKYKQAVAIRSQHRADDQELKQQAEKEHELKAAKVHEAHSNEGKHVQHEAQDLRKQSSLEERAHHKTQDREQKVQAEKELEAKAARVHETHSNEGERSEKEISLNESQRELKEHQANEIRSQHLADDKELKLNAETEHELKTKKVHEAHGAEM